MFDDTPTAPMKRVTVERRKVTPDRPKVHPRYREWLDTPLGQQPTPPHVSAWRLVLAVALLAVFATAIITEVIR